MQIIQEKMSRLFEINRSLTQSLLLEDILKKLVEAAFDLMNNADTIILYNLKEDGLLHFAQGVGVNEKVMCHVKFEPGESLTGKVFLSKKGVICSGDDIKVHMNSMSKTNYDFFFKGIYQREVKSGIVVPLLYKEDCIGVLVVDNFNENNVQFSQAEIQIIEIIADQAAIAIMNSKLYHQVKSKNEELSYSLDIHRKFTKILLEGKGSKFILDTISRILSTSVTYSETKNNHPNYFPIINSNEVFGYLVLHKPIESLSNIQKSALEHAATAMALESVKQNTLFEKELHVREEMFQEIISGIRSESSLKIMKKFKFHENSKIACMIVDSKEGYLWDMDTILQKENLIRSIEKNLLKYCETNVVFTKAFQLVILLSLERNLNYKKLAEEIEEGIINKNQSIAIGMGRDVPVSEIADSYKEATEAVAFCKSIKNKKFVTYSELGVERLWLNTNPFLLRKFAHDKIGMLLEMEKEYINTLKVFISNNKSHKRTAASLHIHPNTLAYRLKKIERRLCIDFHCEEDWINIVLALQISDYLNC